MRIDIKQLMETLQRQMEGQLTFLQKDVQALRAEALEWRPDPEAWTVTECLEHLNRYGRFYLPLLEEAIQSGVAAPNTSYYKSSWLGNYLANSMQPKEGKVKNKMATFRSKNPLRAKLDANSVIEEHLHQQLRLQQVLGRSDTVDFNHTRLPTTLGPLIKMKYGDLLRFYLNHLDRHYLQIREILGARRKALEQD